MKKRTRLVVASSFLSLALVSIGFSVAQAQTGGTPPAGPAPAVTGGLSRDVNLSLDEISKRAEGAMARMEMNIMAIQALLSKNDSQTDSMKFICLNDKLTIADTRFRYAKDRKPSLDSAVMNKDQGSALMLYQVIQSHREESDKARAQAESCIGSEIGFVGDTRTTSTESPDIPPETGGPPPPLFIPGLDLPALPPPDTSPKL